MSGPSNVANLAGHGADVQRRRGGGGGASGRDEGVGELLESCARGHLGPDVEMLLLMQLLGLLLCVRAWPKCATQAGAT